MMPILPRPASPRRPWQGVAFLAALAASAACQGRATPSRTAGLTTGNDAYVNACGEDATVREAAAEFPASRTRNTVLTPEQRKAALAVKDVFAAECATCHTGGGAGGGPDDILEPQDVKPYVNPASPDASRLVDVLRSGRMPLGGTRLPDTTIAQVRAWIALGAPSWKDAERPQGNAAGERLPAFVSRADEAACIARDLAKRPAARKSATRYVSLAAAFDRGLDDEGLRDARLAMSKVLNHLSWMPQVARPVAIDPMRLIYRIDLGDYGWERFVWESLSLASPYQDGDGSPFDAANRRDTATTGEGVSYVLRADWLALAASQPPFYYRILELPDNELALERKVFANSVERFPVLAGINAQRVLRAGFAQSGVSVSNRLIERHVTPFGAYWKSYDFAQTDARDATLLFTNPFGPCTIHKDAVRIFTGVLPCDAGLEAFQEAKAFRHQGGEIIFNLPNGLQGYYVANAAEKRLAKAPQEIVTDPNSPDRAVIAGVSCMRCHDQGMQEKRDEVRPAIEASGLALTRAQEDFLKAAYADDATLGRAFAEDGERFRAAMARAGMPRDADGKLVGKEPVGVSLQRYADALDIAGVAGELGMAVDGPDGFKARVAASPRLRPVFASLLQGGRMSRGVFEGLYAAAALGLRERADIASRIPARLAPQAGTYADPRLTVAIKPRVVGGSLDAVALKIGQRETEILCYGDSCQGVVDGLRVQLFEFSTGAFTLKKDGIDFFLERQP